MRMEKKRELLKRTGAVIVSLAMVLVMLGSMGMEVRAAETKEVTFKNVNQSAARGVWQRLGKVRAGTEITFRAYDDENKPQYCYLKAYYWLRDSDFDFGSEQDEDIAYFFQYSSIGSSTVGTDYILNEINSEYEQQTLTVGNGNGYANLWDVNAAVMSIRDDKCFVVILTPATEDATPTSAGGAIR